MANVGKVGLGLVWREGSVGTVLLHKQADLNVKPQCLWEVGQVETGRFRKLTGQL